MLSLGRSPSSIAAGIIAVCGFCYYIDQEFGLLDEPPRLYPVKIHPENKHREISQLGDLLKMR